MAPKDQYPSGNTNERALLNLLTEVLNSDSGATQLGEMLVGKISALLNAELSLILYLNNSHHEVIVQRAGAAHPLRVFNIDVQTEDGSLKECLAQKTKILINSWPPDVTFPLDGAIKEFQPKSMLCIPMIVAEKMIGTIAAFNKLNGSFDELDEGLLVAVANTVGWKVYNDSKLQELQVSNANLEVNRWQLMHSRNILRALFDSIPTSIYIIDRKYKLAAVNKHRADRINSPPHELVGRRCFEALYHLDDPCADCRVVETLFGEQSTLRTKRAWEGGFDIQEWEISSYPIHDEKGQVVQAILLEQEVTEKRRLEATLAQSEKLAAVGQLAAGLAHEINNPLTAIIANAQLLQREIPPGDDKQELVELIARAGERANQVVRNLLDLSRKEQYNFAKIDINETIRKALELLHHEFVSRAVNLTFTPAENLPKISAMPNKPRQIELATRLQGAEIYVTVKDSGEGISEEKLTRIFEPFYTTKEPGKGTGLGLSVCHRIIKQHGGNILVDSKVNVGTQFTVILPVA